MDLSNNCENGGVNQTKVVRIIWVDTSGQHRCRVIPSTRFNDVVKKNGVGLSVVCMARSSHTEIPIGKDLTGVGEIRLLPDLSTKRIVPWMEQEEMVMGDMYIRPGEAWEYCPRETLRRLSSILKNEFDLEMKAGFEIEFLLLKKAVKDGKEDWVPFDSSSYCSTFSYDAAAPFFHDIVDCLNSLNITVEQLHAEAAEGQFEFALGYTTCLTAADELIYTREVIKAVARKHGLLATFIPKYAMDDVGSGCHVHISLWQNGKNVLMAADKSSKHGMSTIGEEFMAGVLYHIPSILPFIAPLPNSYDRIQPNTLCGAYHCWGKDNREAPIRTASPPGIGVNLVSNFEVKSFDGLANPYLGLASILCAGLDGLRNHIQLPQPIDTNPSYMDLKFQRLPQSLSEALEALENNNMFTNLIGERLLTAIKEIRKAEVNHYSKHQEAYKQLIHRY
ncbi:type-1 glutamine synthetase 1 isoform X1 [Cucumis sativus]|uniref:GS catalytic domain-containing protein n=1 Tax=Cucumis sativus TaxID=3659 RepID=A0A0A0KKB4_CUCSA|nr:type-1 glutamine synthetase 1 isoform X1 [Cucumis sativus]